MVMEDNALASGGISYGAAVSVGHWVWGSILACAGWGIWGSQHVGDFYTADGGSALSAYDNDGDGHGRKNLWLHLWEEWHDRCQSRKSLWPVPAGVRLRRYLAYRAVPGAN
ncbi:hypothetical protein AXG93_223s1170 [Marchantia polymorpha subsp. ruderalis]|uniref:Uncharacterized protein n=1 Tax=Marchantia polymorpha subsp. ruderalis TaxID=1480154 RepID=A0A176W6P9_MARPO|nr:hypothetical protein AXG93_223s1170 [Marchantia polymorpha subsp. ruderalis]